MYLWDLKNRRHCWSGWFSNLNIQTLGGASIAQMAAEPVCSWTREEARRCYRESANEEEGGDIYNLGSKCRAGIWCAVYLENRDLFEHWQSWLELISEQQINYSETWGHVLTQFFDMCQGRWYHERKVADSEETKTCTGSGSADEVAADGLEVYSMKMLIRTFWWSADESCRWVRKKEGSPNFTRILMIRL